MADYIFDVAAQTSKLDWAFPFQRTGAFPLDRSVLFSSLEDAKNYAKGDGSDERALGGTSYIGQVISVLEGDEVSAYIITKTRSLMKLAATTSSGDLASDIATLEGKVTSLQDSVDSHTTRIEAVEKSAAANAEAIEKIGDVDKKISEAVAAADHLSRKIVTSVDDIDVNADDAEKYIYMVPNGENEEGDKYDEYMVLEIAGTKVLEKVGDWAIDLSDYATKSEVKAVSDAVNSKVTAEAGKRLMTDAEGEKLAGIEEGAEKNLIKSVAEEFSVSEAGELNINSISMAKVDGLAAKFDGYVKNDSNKLLTDNDKAKLAAIDLDEDGNASIDVEKVSNLASWLNDHASDTPGLSENNYDNDAKAKLADLLSIKSVKSSQLEVSEAGELSIKAIDVDLVTGLTAWTDKVTANTNSINTLTTTLDNHVKNYTALSEKVDDLDARLTWQELE